MNAIHGIVRYLDTRNGSAIRYLISMGLVIAALICLFGNVHSPAWFMSVLKLMGGLALVANWLMSISIFSCSGNSNLLDRGSGIDRCLLRLPISSGQIALTLSGLTTVWVFGGWIIATTTARIAGASEIPILIPTLCMSTFAICLCSLIWMPQPATWTRPVLFALTLPVAYALGVSHLYAFYEAPQWLPLTSTLTVLAYLVALFLAQLSVCWARVSRFEQSSRRSASLAKEQPQLGQRRSFADVRAALNWYDARRSLPKKVPMLFTTVPLVAFGILVLPFSSNMFGLYLLLVTVASAAALSRIEASVFGAISSLPSYLIVSPIRSDTLAYVRLHNVATTFLKLMFLLSLLSMASFVWPSNRLMLANWCSRVATTYGSELAPLATIVAASGASLVASAGIVLRLACVQMWGRQKLVLTLVFVAAAVPVCIFWITLPWFLRQTQWSVVQHTAAQWRDWSYWLLYVALAIKLSANLSLITMARRREACPLSKIVLAQAAWALLVLSASGLWWALWPGPAIHWATVLISASLAIPFSIYLAGPLAISSNRHRVVDSRWN